jgi:hypothetical protein
VPPRTIAAAVAAILADRSGKRAELEGEIEWEKRKEGGWERKGCRVNGEKEKVGTL